METAYLTTVLCLLIGFGISIVLTIRILSHPPALGRTSLMMSIIGAAVWLFGYAMEMVSGSLEEKIFWAKVQYIGIPFVAPGIFSFVLEYTGRGSWLTQIKRLTLGVIPVLVTILAFSNNQLKLLWSSVRLMPDLSISPLLLEHGPGFYVIVGYSYLLMAIATILLIKMLIATDRFYRYQVIWMLIGLMPPWIGNAIYATRILPLAGVDLTPLLLTFANITFLMGFLRVKLLDFIPIARDTVFQSITDGVIVLDEQERIIEANPAAKSIFPGGKHFIGSKINQLLPSWDEWGQNQAKVTFEFQNKTQIYEVRLNPILNERKKRNGQLVILKDITERKRYETDLQQANSQAVEANRVKTKLLANVSHDLRTPLGAILGYTEMLHTGNLGPLTAEQENATAEVLDSTNKLLVFINNLIGQAQIETGRILIVPRSFNPNELIEGIRATARFWAKKKNLSLSYDLDPQLPERILGDVYWLKQVLLNLVNNAIKFTDEGGVYVYLAQVDANHWSVEVRDTGIGIPTEARERIFEAFQQVENDNQRKISGSGLGLSIVHELVSLMDGQVRLESETGVGSTFIIILPLLPIPE